MTYVNIHFASRPHFTVSILQSRFPVSTDRPNITGPSPASYNVLCMLKALARGNRHFILTELKIMAPP